MEKRKSCVKNCLTKKNMLIYWLVLCAILNPFQFQISAAYGETVEELPSRPLFQPLPTVDGLKYQWTVRLIDFPTNQPENAFLLDSSTSHGTKAYPGLLSAYLGEDGYPTNQEGVSMAELFIGAAEVNHLFLAEPLDRDGVWEFDSTQCFASLHGSDFTVYRELGTLNKGGSSTTLDHGQFLPFNDLTAAVSQEHPTNERDALNRELTEDDPRKGEPLYAVADQDANHYFGLEMEISFLYPAGGRDGQDQDLTAYFSGDDDVWVYIDGVLVLDLGGIHSAIPGSINFSTGAVTYRDGEGKDQTIKLAKLFEQRYRTRYPEAKEWDVQAYLREVFRENSHWQKVFQDDSVHTLRVFYLERGAGASNLHIRFNLPVLEK